MDKLELKFYGTSPELYECSFIHNLLPQPMKSVRGKVSGAFANYGTFQWTKAVRAFCILAVSSKLSQLSGNSVAGLQPLLGASGSLAASLDYAIQKEPIWILDMFGMDSTGTCCIRRLLNRSNPGRKRSGPVGISWNINFLSPKAITFEWDDTKYLNSENLHTLLSGLSEVSSGTEVLLAA